MRFDWIIIETITVLIGSFAIFYFLNKRFQAKYDSIWLNFIAFFLIIVWSLISTFLRWPPHIYDITLFVLLVTYLLLLKEDLFLQKILGAFMVLAISMAVSLAGAGLAALMTNSTYQQTLETQGMTRLLALIFIKMIQVTVLYALAKKAAANPQSEKEACIGVMQHDFYKFHVFTFHLVLCSGARHGQSTASYPPGTYLDCNRAFHSVDCPFCNV